MNIQETQKQVWNTFKPLNENLVVTFIIYYNALRMYAVVAIQGHQYLVKAWDSIAVDRINADQGSKHTFSDVLLTFNEDWSTVSVWAPIVDGGSVECTVEEHFSGDKLRVIKFQGKKRYKRTKWFRAKKTLLSITKVNG